MIDLGKKIEELKCLLKQSLNHLNGINSQNFDFNIGFAKNSMKSALALRQELKSGYNFEELKIFDPELTNMAKQISEKFDNIVREKRQELEIVAKKIKMVQNQKKLLNYSR